MSCQRLVVSATLVFAVLLSGCRAAVRAQPPPAPKQATAPARPAPPGTAEEAAVRVGGDISEPKKVIDASPVYPDLARSARLAGKVILEVVIGPDGKVQSVKILQSVPALDEAAVAAVKRWVFEPTILNGVAVPVLMTVSLKFPPDK